MTAQGMVVLPGGGIRAFTASQAAFATSGSSACIMMSPPVGVLLPLGIKSEATPQLVDFRHLPADAPSTCSIEEVAATSGGELWFHVYAWPSTAGWLTTSPAWARHRGRSPRPGRRRGLGLHWVPQSALAADLIQQPPREVEDRNQATDQGRGDLPHQRVDYPPHRCLVG